jgi:hypothetical protein
MNAPLSFHGLCSICGAKGEFVRGTGHSTRESFPCPSCRASLRYRDQAALVLDEFARGRSISLANLVASGRMAEIDIYEPALKGPFVNAFKALPRYVRSYYWPERAPGAVDAHGVRNEDITALSFGDNSFDLVITSDVMEHVYEYKSAFAEIFRVAIFANGLSPKWSEEVSTCRRATTRCAPTVWESCACRRMRRPAGSSPPTWRASSRPFFPRLPRVAFTSARSV